MAFDVTLFDDAERQLKKLSARDQRIILDAIDKHLRFQPNQPTRNRKQLRENKLATWELRVGAFRVFYDMLEQGGVVGVVAIGKKDGNTVVIEGKEYPL